MFGMIPYRNNNLKNENREYMNPFADDFFRAFFGDERMSAAIKVDVEDKGDSYLMEADLPGVDKEDVHVDVENGVLTLSVQHDESRENNGKNYVCRERRSTSSSRSFNMDGIDESAISAEFKDGVLKLKLPKQAQPETGHRIEIN